MVRWRSAQEHAERWVQPAGNGTEGQARGWSGRIATSESPTTYAFRNQEPRPPGDCFTRLLIAGAPYLAGSLDLDRGKASLQR